MYNSTLFRITFNDIGSGGAVKIIHCDEPFWQRTPLFIPDAIRSHMVKEGWISFRLRPRSEVPGGGFRWLVPRPLGSTVGERHAEWHFKRELFRAHSWTTWC